ncbi:hypothetical protein ACV242_005515 [Peribacillus simplex]
MNVSDKHNARNLNEIYAKEVAELLGEDFSVSIDSFREGINKLGIDVNVKYLLKSLHGQKIETDICDYLLLNNSE